MLKYLSELLDKAAPKLPELNIQSVFDFVNMKLPPRENILSRGYQCKDLR